MNWLEQRTRIKRYLRDPSSNIWGNALILNLFNDTQRDIQNRTKYLENIVALRVPQLYQHSYLYDWEYGYLPSTQSLFYQFFKWHQQSNMAMCFEWEMQQQSGITPDIPSDGYACTNPWEQLMVQSDDPHKMRFPKNFHQAKYMAYDKEPIQYTSERAIQMHDPSYKTRQGEVNFYYRPDTLDNEFVLYPRPSSGFQNALVGAEAGMVLFLEDDTTSAEVGDIQVRDDTTPSDSVGVTVDVVDADSSVFIAFEAIPTDIVDPDDESDFPQYMQKYIEYGTLARLFMVNNDGKSPSLAKYWEMRYEIGINHIKSFMGKRLADRDYRLRTKDTPTQVTRKHPRLPSTYPAI